MVREGVASIDLLHLIDRLEELVGEARRLPIGTASVIDRRRLLDIVDQLRAAVPTEVREAQEVLQRKEEVLAKADEEAAMRMSRADEEVDRRVSESEIAKAAELRGQDIIAEAELQTQKILAEAQTRAEAKRAEGERLAMEQMDEADRYAMEMLRKLEQQLEAFASSVRAGIQTLERRPEEQTPPPASPSYSAEPAPPASPEQEPALLEDEPSPPSDDRLERSS